MDKYKVTHLIMKHFFGLEHFQKIVAKIKAIEKKFSNASGLFKILGPILKDKNLTFECSP